MTPNPGQVIVTNEDLPAPRSIVSPPAIGLFPRSTASGVGQNAAMRLAGLLTQTSTPAPAIGAGDDRGAPSRMSGPLPKCSRLIEFDHIRARGEHNPG